MKNWYQLDLSSIESELVTDFSTGLVPDEAAKRLGETGPNELVESGVRSPWRILFEQFTATMVLILMGAALLSGLLGEYKDAVAIGTIVVLFAFLGFVQEYRAERAMAALKRLATPLVRVLRQGQLIEISARELVPGDVFLLETGNLVPADSRILESVNLRVQEAALTGESEPVEKTIDPFPGVDLPLGDRRNMAYMGTVVTYGRGKALVVATGMDTELGKISSMLQNVENEQTPLQRRLDQLGKLLAIVGLIVAGAVFLFGMLREEPLRDMLLTSVSIAVAVVPEGLPAVVTITLALGAQRMLKRNALIRKLPAVETLGSVTVICSDKTGTLTENRMTVIVLDIAGHQINLTESMHNRMPLLKSVPRDVSFVEQNLITPPPKSIQLLLAGGALCNDAMLVPGSGSGEFNTIGDPTEGALVIAAANFQLYKGDLEKIFPRVAEVPFDSERKRMSTLHELADRNAISNSAETEFLTQIGDRVVFSKGAVDSLLGISAWVQVDDRIEALSPDWRERIESTNDQLAQQGMRMLGVAYRSDQDSLENGFGDADDHRSLEQDLIFVGLVGMIDPPRREVKDAVQTCMRAGIRPVMITGDHPLTARQIARELGIIGNGAKDARVITGLELDRINEAELSQLVNSVAVYARVSPEHKLRIVEALQRRGNIVAMTGDGVNDAPALKRANIGVAMGITGTDVSKEAAEMVLQDDNFSTIVSAVEEGRTIYDNLRKFVKFSVAGNVGKVSVMLLAPFLGKPLPLLPLQLLWLNLLTDGLLGLGLGLEPPEKDVMRRPPYSPRMGLFSQGLGQHIIWVGCLIGAIALGVGYVYWRIDPQGNWQTMTFTTLAFAQFAQALASRSSRESLFTLGITSNMPGMLIAALVFLLQLAVLYMPFLQDFFGTQILTIRDLLISIGLSGLVFIAIEVEKWLIRQRG